MKSSTATSCKISLIITLSILCLSLPLIAGAPDTLWTRTYGGDSTDEIGYSVQQTSDGGFIIAGNTCSMNPIFGYVYLIRTNAIGDTLWTKIYNRSGFDFGYSVQQTADNGFIIVGGAYEMIPEMKDVYLIRTSSSGDTIWTKTLGGTFLGGPNQEYGRIVRLMNDGGFIIAGNLIYYGPNEDKDVYLVRTNSNGDTLWTKNIGGSGDQSCSSMEITRDSGFILCGTTTNYTNYTDDVYLARTNSEGDTLWTKKYDGTKYEYGHSVQQTSDGGYIIAANKYLPSDPVSGDIYLIRTDSNGDTLWTRTYGGSDFDVSNSVLQTNDGGFILLGYTDSFGADYSGAYLIRTNSKGDTLWKKTYSNVGVGYSIKQTSDGGFIIVGSLNRNIYLIKLDKETTGIKEGNPSTSNDPISILNHPNPFSKSTTISYTTRHPGNVTIKIYNLFGKRVKTLVDEHKPSGTHHVKWNGASSSNLRVAKGVYYSVVTVDSGDKIVRQRRKMVVE